MGWTWRGQLKMTRLWISFSVSIEQRQVQCGSEAKRQHAVDMAWRLRSELGVSLMSNLAHRPGSLWRRLLAVVLVHAVAVQALLVALGGFSLTANADQSPPAFELCSHGVDGAAQSPVKIPDLSGCTHCVFCLAGAHHAVVGAAERHVPPTLCCNGGRAMARRCVGPHAAHPLHDRKSPRPSAQRVTGPPTDPPMLQRS